MTSRPVPAGIVLRQGTMAEPELATVRRGLLKIGKGEEIICPFETETARKYLGEPQDYVELPDDEWYSPPSGGKPGFHCDKPTEKYQDCRADVTMEPWCRRVAVWKNVPIECGEDELMYVKNGVSAYLTDPDYILRLADFCEKHKQSHKQCDHARVCDPTCPSCWLGPRPNRFDEFPVVWRTGTTVHFDFNSVTDLHSKCADGKLAWPDAMKLLASKVWECGLGGHPHNIWVYTQFYRWRQRHWRRCDRGDSENCTRSHYYWSDHGPAAVDYAAGALIWLCGEPNGPTGNPTCAEPLPNFQ